MAFKTIKLNFSSMSQRDVEVMAAGTLAGQAPGEARPGRLTINPDTGTEMSRWVDPASEAARRAEAEHCAEMAWREERDRMLAQQRDYESSRNYDNEPSYSPNSYGYGC